MERIAVDDVAPATDGRGRERRALAGALGAEQVALNHYRVAPGERVSGLHGHGDQAELFLVVDGTATVEHYEGTAGRTVEVAADGAVRFAPGEYQSVRNAGEDTLELYALGAPPDSEDVRIPLACPDCGHGHVRPTLAGDGDPVLACPDCDAEAPVECPDCGSDAMHAVLGADGEPVSACRDCGHESATL